MANYDYYGKYWTNNTVTQAEIIPRLDDQAMRTFGEIYLYDQIAKLQVGRIMAKDHPQIERMMWQVDPCLRLRWEFEHPDSNEYKQFGMWAIDRFVKELGYFWTIFYWDCKTLEEGTALRQLLWESDMQRPGYHADKKLKHELILKAQEKKRSEIALAAIDELTDAQCKQFVDVETALATGEKIHVRGKDADQLNRMYEETKKRDAMGLNALIPGAGTGPGAQMSAAQLRRFRFGK